MGLRQRLFDWLVKGLGRDADTARYAEYDRHYGIAATLVSPSDLDRYATSDDVYGAVELLTNCATTVPFIVKVGGEKVEDHDLAYLLNVRPNPYLGSREFWRLAYQWMLLTGECITVLERTNPLDRAMPNELWAFSGEHFTPIPAKGKPGIDHYRYEPSGQASKGINIPRADVLPLLLRNPAQPDRGLSPLSSLRLGLDSERQAKSANRDLFANGMLIDGALSVEGPLTQEQRERATAELAKRHGGAGNRHRLLLLEAGKAAYVPMKMTPRDAEFIELDKLTTRDVAKAFCIPPMYLADLEHATLANFEQGEKMLWTLGVLPKVRLVCDAVTANLAWQFGPDVTVEPDLSDVAALRVDAKAQAETAKLWVEAGFDPRWAGERVLGEELPPEAIADKPDPVATPWRLATPPASDDDRGAGQDPTARSLAVVTSGTRVKALADRYRRVAELRGEQAEAMMQRVHAGLQAQRALLVENCDRLLKGHADDLLVSLWTADVTTELETALFDGLAEAAGSAVAGADVLFGLRVDVGRALPMTRAWARERAADQVQWVDEYTRELLRRGIQFALDNGQGLKGVREQIINAFRDSDEPWQEFAYADRVENITQTELARGWGFGQLAAMREAGVEWQQWLSSGLPISRHGPEREKGNGQIVRIGEAFNLNGHRALYPADPALPIAQAARCKCVVIPSDGPGDDA